jgi:hypothetical protein
VFFYVYNRGDGFIKGDKIILVNIFHANYKTNLIKLRWMYTGGPGSSKFPMQYEATDCAHTFSLPAFKAGCNFHYLKTAQHFDMYKLIS